MRHMLDASFGLMEGGTVDGSRTAYKDNLGCISFELLLNLCLLRTDTQASAKELQVTVIIKASITNLHMSALVVHRQAELHDSERAATRGKGHGRQEIGWAATGGRYRRTCLGLLIQHGNRAEFLHLQQRVLPEGRQLLVHAVVEGVRPWQGLQRTNAAVAADA